MMSPLTATRGAVEDGIEVLLVGPPDCPVLSNLADALDRDGWPASRLVRVRELAAKIQPHGRAVVVVRAHDAAPAFEALEALEPMRHSTLLIVVVDRAELGQYYCLMQDGAVEYFEASEDPLRILQGVEWAARVLAP